MSVELISNLARTVCDFGFVHTDRISVISGENVLPNPSARRATSLDLSMHSSAELFHKGLQLKENKDYRGAIEAFHAAIQLQWNLTAAHIEQGNCASLLGQHDRALGFYSSAIETDRCSAIPYYNTGLTWLDLRNHEQAYAWFSRTIEIDRAYRLAYLRLAQLHANSRQDRSAITLLIRAAQIEPKIAAPLVAAGALYYKNTDTVRAIHCFERALRIDAWSTDAYYYLGFAYYRQSDFARAVRSLSLAVNSDPSNKLARALLNLVAKELRPKQVRTAPIQTDLFHATAHPAV